MLFPLQQVIAVLLGTAPAIVWLIFFLQEDKKCPEPKKLIVSTFILGGLVTFVTLYVQVLFNQWATGVGITNLSPVSLTALAFLEELSKFFVVFFWIHNRREFNEPIDAMIYMIVAALGFSTVENIASAIQAANGFELIAFRLVGATLLHTLSAGIIGFYWGLGKVKKARVWLYIIFGLILATLLHGIFNYLIVQLGQGVEVAAFLIFFALFVLNDFEQLKRRNPSPVCT